MTFTLDPLSIFILLSIGQCVFLMIVLLTGRSMSKASNALLLLLVFAFLWYQTEFFLIRNSKLGSDIPFLFSTRYGSWFLIGPLILLFTRASLIRDFKLLRTHLLHFVPFVVFTLLIPLLSNEIITNRSVDYGMLTVFDNWNRVPITWQQYVYGAVFIAQFLHGMIYFSIAFHELQEYKSKVKDFYSSFDQQTFNTHRYLILVGILIIVVVSTFIAYQFITMKYRRNADYFYALPMALIIYGISYRAIKYPKSLIHWEEVKSKRKYEKSSLSDQAADHYLKKLETAIEVEKVYRKNDLRLVDLAEQLDTTTHHLSQVINEKLNQNFFDYINSFRVNEAISLIRQEQDKSLLEIAYAVGFNNKNSFNNAFKKHSGMNPSEMKRQK